MKNDVMANVRCCGSCEYWSGSRQVKPNSGGTVYQVEDFYSPQTSGSCLCGKSVFASRERVANGAFCNCYQKWRALK